VHSRADRSQLYLPQHETKKYESRLKKQSQIDTLRINGNYHESAESSPKEKKRLQCEECVDKGVKPGVKEWILRPAD